MSNTPKTPDDHRKQRIAKIGELIAETQLCMFTTTDATGQLMSRPIGLRETKFDGELWFIAMATRKVNEVCREAHVNIAFASRHAWVLLTGVAEIVCDVAKAKELWGPNVDAWFPRGSGVAGVSADEGAGRWCRVLRYPRRDHRVIAFVRQVARDRRALQDRERSHRPVRAVDSPTTAWRDDRLRLTLVRERPWTSPSSGLTVPQVVKSFVRRWPAAIGSQR